MKISAKKEIPYHYLYFTTWDVSSLIPWFLLCTHPFKNIVSTLWRTCLLYKTWTQMYNGEHKTWWVHKSLKPAPASQSVRPLRRCASEPDWNKSELCCRGDVSSGVQGAQWAAVCLSAEASDVAERAWGNAASLRGSGQRAARHRAAN